MALDARIEAQMQSPIILARIASWQQLKLPDGGYLRKQLPGRIIVVRGNHDRSHAAMIEEGFDAVHAAVRIESGDQHWIGRHNPAAFSVREAASAQRLLHGHSHGNGCGNDVNPPVRDKAMDCSLDALRSVAPMAWDNLIARP